MVDVKESEAITLMEVDVDRITKNLHNFHETWACLVEIIVAIWLLERQLGATCAVPALVTICMETLHFDLNFEKTADFYKCPLWPHFQFQKKFKNSQKLWVQRIGRRVIVTAGVLGNIKVVKMLGLNKAVFCSCV